MKNIRESYKIETLDKFIVDNYSDLFENIKKPVLGSGILKIKQQTPEPNTLKNNINKKNINVNNKIVGQGVNAVVPNANITLSKIKPPINNKKVLGSNPLDRLKNKNESYYFTDADIIKYQELLESLHTIDNLRILAFNGKTLDGLYSNGDATYHNLDNIIYLQKSLMNNYGKQDELEAFFVHELIHFLDINNIRTVYPSNLYNVNRKIREAGFKFQIDTNLFSNVFRQIASVNRNNYNNFFEPYTIDLLKFLRDEDYSNHSTQIEIRAYVGQFLYWSKIDGDEQIVKDKLFGWQYDTYEID